MENAAKILKFHELRALAEVSISLSDDRVSITHVRPSHWAGRLVGCGSSSKLSAPAYTCPFLLITLYDKPVTMAVGKNKLAAKGGRKGGKKKYALCTRAMLVSYLVINT